MLLAFRSLETGGSSCGGGPEKYGYQVHSGLTGNNWQTARSVADEV